MARIKRPASWRIAQLEAQVEGLTERLEDMKLRNRLLRDRPDLPIERLRAYDELIALWTQQHQRVVDENRRLKRGTGEGDTARQGTS